MAEKTGRKPMTSIDQLVPLRIRQQRIMLGWTQQQLAEMIGVTYQQLHKYETGRNRITSGRLHEIAKALGQPIEWFFDQSDEAKTVPISSQALLAMNRAWLELSPELQQSVREHITGLLRAQRELEDARQTRDSVPRAA